MNYKMSAILGLLLLAVALCGCTDEKSGVTNSNGVDITKGDAADIAEAYLMQHVSVDPGSIRFGTVRSEFAYNVPAINMPMTFTTNGTEHYAQVIYEQNGRISFASIDGVAV